MLDGTAYTFDAATHEYKVNGSSVPGCTRVLDRSGLVNFRFVEQDILEQKSALGREVHRACHLMNQAKVFKCDEQVAPYLHSCVMFCERTNFRPVLTEFQQIGYVNNMPFGMQIDAFGVLGGADTVVEWKIGDVLPHHGIQLAGYAAGLEHKSLVSPFARFRSRRRIVVQLRPNAYPKVTRFDATSDFEVFAAALFITHWKMQFETQYKGENVK